MLKNHRGVEKVETDLNVYEAAKERFKFCFNNYDEVIVNYSGGKDSMVCVLVALEAMKELGIKEKLKVVFYDQEIVYPQTVESVQEVFDLPEVEGLWLYLRFRSGMIDPDASISEYITWEDGREHIRKMPEGALTNEIIYDMFSAEEAVDDLVFHNKRNIRVCQVLGIRAEENISRLGKVLASHKKGAQCFLFKSKIRNFQMAMPIYDWTDNDVFYYLKGQKRLSVNKLYQLLMVLNRPLRVSPPIHSKQISNLHTIKLINPTFYERVVEVFGDFDTTAKYSQSLNATVGKKNIYKKYGVSVRGIREYIATIKDEESRLSALSALKRFIKDYIEYDRYTKFGHTYESALKECFAQVLNHEYSRNFMLRNKVENKKEKAARELLEKENENEKVK